MAEEVEKIPSPERMPAPELGREAAPEMAPQIEQAPVKETVNEAVPAATVVVPVAAPEAPVDPTVRSIEKILSEDLMEQFKAMSPEEQAKFRVKGEETVSKLVLIMNKTVIKAKEVLMLIVGWLRFIPHVNKYFLEQESKIKTDKILELHKRQHGE